MAGRGVDERLRGVRRTDVARARVPVTYSELRCGAFGYGGSRGNETVVVFGGGGLSVDVLQRVAARHALETTVVLPARTPVSDFRLRFFLPEREASMCVHGTIGAIAALASMTPDLPRDLQIETPIGSLPATWSGDASGVVVTVGQREPSFLLGRKPWPKLAEALGADLRALDETTGPVQSVGVSRAKLVVPVRDVRALDALAPAWGALWELCDALDVSGVYAITRNVRCSDRDVDARQFPARAGLLEDPATGVAAAALAAYLTLHSPDGLRTDGVRHYRVGQGDAMGSPCLLEAAATVKGGQIVSTSVTGSGVVFAATP